MPSKSISLKDLNNWNKYSKNLNRLSFVKKYLGDTLKIWVQNKNNFNPLSITLIANLFKDTLSSFNKNLSAMEKSIAEGNLSELLYELKNQKSDPIYKNFLLDSSNINMICDGIIYLKTGNAFAKKDEFIINRGFWIKNKQKYYSGNISYVKLGLHKRILGKVLFKRILTFFKNPHNHSLYNHFARSHQMSLLQQASWVEACPF
jgi:hypothetical protein